MLSRIKALVIVFLVGVCVTALEISSARLISPYFGSTIYVWGGSIGVVLFALAIGYWLGGFIIDKKPDSKILAWVIIIAGITTLVIPWMYHSTTYALSHWSALKHIPVSIGVLVSMLVLFLVPIVALGMVSPMVLRLSMKSVEKAGSWSGLLSGAATFGSIIGTFCSAYATIPLLGTRWTILVSAGILFIVSVIIRWPSKKISATMLAGLLVTSGIIWQTSFVPRPGLAAEKESAYQLVQVIEQQRTRFLVFDAARGAQSLYDPTSVHTKTMYDGFGLLPYLQSGQTKQRSVLLLGLAGGNIVKAYKQLLEPEFQFSITAVEIDPAVVQIAKKYFATEAIDFVTVVDDARHFLRNTDERYDIIIIDAYTHETQIPPMLATVEFFQAVRDHLNPKGIVGINAMAFPESRYLSKFLSTIATVFPDVWEAPFVPGALNHLIVASDKIDQSLVPTQMQAVVEPYRKLTLEHLQRVVPNGNVYTDDRTDLDIRARPFLE